MAKQKFGNPIISTLERCDMQNTREDTVKRTHFYNNNSTTVAVSLDRVVNHARL